jgi:hypothetical protein
MANKQWTTLNRIAQQWKCKDTTAMTYLKKFNTPLIRTPGSTRVLYKDLERLPKMRKCIILPAAPTHSEIRQRCLEIQAGWNEETRAKRRVASEKIVEIMRCAYLGDDQDLYTEESI